MYVTICEIEASASFMHEAGHPKPVLWDNREGWGGEGGGRGLRMGDSCG